jgi:hypothetical protein
MVHLPAWIPGAITKLVELFRPQRPKLTLEIRQVCFDKKLESLEADLSDDKIDLYIFLHVWAVNIKGVPTTAREWKLSVIADDQKIEGERVEDISKWQQHSKEQGVSRLLCKRPGFVFGMGCRGRVSLPLPIDVGIIC